MLAAASFESSGASLAKDSARLSRPEPAFRSGFSLAHDDGRWAAVMGSLFPTCFFNASLNYPQVRSARGFLLVPVCSGAGDLNAACPLP
jgi:hypothetical protein